MQVIKSSSAFIAILLFLLLLKWCSLCYHKGAVAFPGYPIIFYKATFESFLEEIMPDRISNPAPLTPQSDTLPTASDLGIKGTGIDTRPGHILSWKLKIKSFLLIQEGQFLLLAKIWIISTG